MIRRVVAAVAMLLAFSAISSAQAGVPIPCMGTRFLQAPELPNAKDASGQKITLRYNVFGCSDGQWDGYSTPDGKYHKLTASLVASLPKAPGFWASAWQYKARFWVEWLWMIVAALVVIGTAFSMYAQAYGHSPAPANPPSSKVRRS